MLGDTPATVVGHSVGGLVALVGAARRPDLVRSLVAYEPPVPWEPWWRPGAGAGLEGRAPDDAAERFLRRMLGDRTWERFGADFKAERRREGPALLADLRIGRRGAADLDPSTVAVPALVGCGERGSERHRRAARALVASLPQAELVELPDADHGVHLGQPGAFARFVRRGVARDGGNRAGRGVDRPIQAGPGGADQGGDTK